VLISVNGEPLDVAEQATVADVLVELEATARYVAVEVNRQLVPRARHAEHQLQPGDTLEVVTLVGGG
jgi:sulfur carrier protein